MSTTKIMITQCLDTTFTSLQVCDFLHEGGEPAVALAHQAGDGLRRLSFAFQTSHREHQEGVGFLLSILYNTKVQNNKEKYDKIKHITVQYSTVKYNSIIQYNKVK